MTVPEQWGQISKESILASQAERLRASNMRAEIENLVNNAKNGIFSQRDLINDLLKVTEDTVTDGRSPPPSQETSFAVFFSFSFFYFLFRFAPKCYFSL